MSVAFSRSCRCSECGSADIRASDSTRARGSAGTKGPTRRVSVALISTIPSFGEVWSGFSKNLFGLVRYKTVPFFVLMLILFTGCVLPYTTVWFASLTKLSLVAISMNIVMRAVLALKYRHPFFTSVVLHPLGILITLLIGVNSFYQTYLPHRSPKGGYDNLHRARSNAYSTFWSFITCYHFGYHWEHHEYPHIPWWHLPEIRKRVVSDQLSARHVTVTNVVSTIGAVNRKRTDNH